MFLGQPTTAAEFAAEQRALAARAAAREARNARIVAEVRANVARGADIGAECLRAARAYKLGKGGARVVRRWIDSEVSSDV